MKQTIECAFCDGTAQASRQERELVYRKESFPIVAHFYRCAACGEEFTTKESDELSLLQAHNQYREKHNILFPEEIIAIREKYELPALKMSEVLGLGANGYGNYEKGEIPTPAISNLIEAAGREEYFEGLLERAREHFSEKAFRNALARVACLKEQKRIGTPVIRFLNLYNEPNAYTGYACVNERKVAGVLARHIRRGKKGFNDKIKLNKLLFYTDFGHYKRHGRSITGLSYRAIQYGPVPTNYDNLFTYLENEQLIFSDWQRLANGSAREVFATEADWEDQLFSDAEKETIELVSARFANATSWEMVENSHKEVAWIEEHQEKGILSYQKYAFGLVGV